MSSRPRVKLPYATSLVARSAVTHTIGKDNKLPWHLGSDLKRFRKRTIGHVVIMGRKTFESIGRPLPNRINVVLSRRRLSVPGVYWADNVSNALHLADTHTILAQKDDFFVIGGEEIYNLFSDYINKVFLTEVHDRGINGDAKFDLRFEPSEWNLFRRDHFPRSDIDEFEFDLLCYMRKKSVQREMLKDKFLKTYPSLRDHVAPYVVSEDDGDREDADRQLKLHSIC